MKKIASLCLSFLVIGSVLAYGYQPTSRDKEMLDTLEQRVELLSDSHADSLRDIQERVRKAFK